MPNIVNKYVDDYWFSTNIIDCCNIVHINNTHALHMANKKLNEKDEKRRQYHPRPNMSISIENCKTEEDLENFYAKYGKRGNEKRPDQNRESRAQRHHEGHQSYNFVKQKQNLYNFVKEPQNHYNFENGHTLSKTTDERKKHVFRNMYHMPKKSRWWYLDRMKL